MASLEYAEPLVFIQVPVGYIAPVPCFKGTYAFTGICAIDTGSL